jgi:hypothetical protein
MPTDVSSKRGLSLRGKSPGLVAVRRDLQRGMPGKGLHRLRREPAFYPRRNSEGAKGVPVEARHRCAGRLELT